MKKDENHVMAKENRQKKNFEKQNTRREKIKRDI